uniref:ABC transporter substrate-binding protein n=1 Tax=Candidatus Planktophila sp. TaxID=2175601 RepID=UPI0040496C0C
MNSKKSIIAVSVATVALLLGSIAPAQADWKADLVTKGTLINCIDPEYPPMEYYSKGTSGKIIGFDAEASAALAKELKLKIKQLATSFDGLIPALTAGRCDMVWTALYLSNKRLAVADGVPYLETGPGVVVAKGNPKKITDISFSMCGTRIAVQGASANEALVQAQDKVCRDTGKKPIALSSYPKVAETVAALLNGKVDGIVETDVACGDIVNKNKKKFEVAKGYFLGDVSFAAYMQKGSSLTPVVKKAVQKLMDNGKLAKIAKKYNLDPEKLTTVGEPI